LLLYFNRAMKSNKGFILLLYPIILCQCLGIILIIYFNYYKQLKNNLINLIELQQAFNKVDYEIQQSDSIDIINEKMTLVQIPNNKSIGLKNNRLAILSKTTNYLQNEKMPIFRTNWVKIHSLILMDLTFKNNENLQYLFLNPHE
jgi:hypothetical protein